VVLRDVGTGGFGGGERRERGFVSVVRETGDLLSVVFGRRVVEVGTLCRAGTSLAGVRDGDLVRGGRVLVADSVLAAVRVREDRASDGRGGFSGGRGGHRGASKWASQRRSGWSA
jgi:hypothetical protein